MSNPFAAFSIQIGSAGVQAGLPAADPKGAVREHALALKKGESGRFAALDELPGDWWPLAENEPGGYQYRTVVQVLGRRVECMLDGCAGANHVTEELLVGMLNRAAELGIGTAGGPPVSSGEAGKMGPSRVRPRHSLGRAGAFEGRGRPPGHPLGGEDPGRG